MARRVVGSTLATTSLLLGIPMAYGDGPPPPPQLPMATCAERVNDGPGDGFVDWRATPTSPAMQDPRGSVDGLDITGVTFRLTATRVYAFMSLKDIPAALRETDSAYGYYMWFSVGPKMARFDYVIANPQHAALGQPQGYPTASVGTTVTGGPNPMRGLGGGVDATKNVVYVYADRDSLEEQLGGPLADGDQLTAITGKTVLFIGSGATAAGVTQRPADNTDVPAATAVQTVGEDPCFAPSAISAPAVTARYGDPVTLRATLTGEAGAALAERRVTFAVPGESAPRAVTTGADGSVAVTLPAAPAAKTYTFTVTYAGDETSGPGLARGTLTVKPETVRVAPLKLAKSGTARTVTATLTEDDPRPFAKQPVAWYVNGRKVATVLTDSAGRSVYRGAKAGQKVQARYAGATGRYIAVKSGTITA